MKTIRARWIRSISLLLGVVLVGTPLTAHTAPEAPDHVPEGLAKSDWQSIRAAYEAGRHAFQPIEGGWQARNPGQQWTAKFDGRGFVAKPRDGGWQWGLELKGYGFPGAVRDIRGVPAVNADGQRLTYYWDATVQEWWVNDTRGLEHGFTVTDRPHGFTEGNEGSKGNEFSTGVSPAPASLEFPAGASSFPSFASVKTTSRSAPLTFTLAVRGSVTPLVTADGLGVEFRDAAGATVLTYAGLKVWDADGKALPSRFEPIDPRHPSLVTLTTDERGARYPLTIDPIAQQAYLKSSNTGAGYYFGFSVAVSGDTVVVGARHDGGSGAAYVFVRSGTNWTQQAYLKGSDTGAGDQFGCSVAVSGDTVVVGAEYEDSSTTGVNSTPNETGTNSGAAYVFVRSGTNWTQQAYLKASNTGTGDPFGDSFACSVAVSSDTVVVGAKYEDSSTTGVNSAPDEMGYDAGAAYVFVRSGTNWTQQAYLKASNTGASDWFGCSVAVSSDTVVVGAKNEDSSTTGVNNMPNGFASLAGAAYVFVRSGTNWTQQAYLKASNTGANDWFGGSVAVSGDTVVVGADGEDSGTTGVNSTPDERAYDAGAAYVFVRSGTNWTQQAYLKASNTSRDYFGDHFGFSVAVSGDTVVVGAHGEDSSTTGVNGTPNETGTNSGAAYVFVRSGTNWTQQGFLKASNTSRDRFGDHFGFSVAVSGDTVVVGALWEDSGTTGVNRAPDEGAIDSGAAYIFTVTVTPPPPDSLGPTLTITSPAPNSRVSNAVVTVRGTATDNVSVERVYHQLNAGPWIRAVGTTNWEATVELQPGTNLCRAYAFDPAGNASLTNSRSVVFVVTSPLNLSVTGSGTVSPLANGQFLQIGNRYAVKATPMPGNLFSNWTGGLISTTPSLTFTMMSNLTLVANFVPNPFIGLKGSYNGLFYDTNSPAHGNAGFFTLTLTDKGAFSGKLQQGAAKYSFSGQFDLALSAQQTIPRKGTNEVVASLQLTGDSDRLLGMVSNAAWSSELFGYRATFNSKSLPATNFVGSYTLLLPGAADPVEGPMGHGFALLGVNSSGSVSFKGTLGDGSAAAQKVPLAANGQWPFYASLYSGKGSIFSWLTLTNTPTNDVTGLVLWTKPGGVKGVLHPSGFTNELETLGSRYVAPASGTRVVNFSNAVVVLEGGNLSSALSNTIVLSDRNKVTVDVPNPQKLSLSLTVGSGSFKGSFVHPQTGKSAALKGVLLQKQNLGAGFFLGTNQSGRVFFGEMDSEERE